MIEPLVRACVRASPSTNNLAPESIVRGLFLFGCVFVCLFAWAETKRMREFQHHSPLLSSPSCCPNKTTQEATTKTKTTTTTKNKNNHNHKEKKTKYCFYGTK